MTEAKTIDVTTEAVAKMALEWRAISDDPSDIFSEVADLLDILGADRDRIARELETVVATVTRAAVTKAVETEREACAKIADLIVDEYTDRRDDQLREYQPTAALTHGRQAQTASDIAHAIRARTTSPSPPFDEAAERAAYKKWIEHTYGYVNNDTLLQLAWLASAQHRRP